MAFELLQVFVEAAAPNQALLSSLTLSGMIWWTLSSFTVICLVFFYFVLLGHGFIKQVMQYLLL